MRVFQLYKQNMMDIFAKSFDYSGPQTHLICVPDPTTGLLTKDETSATIVRNCILSVVLFL